MFDKKFKLIILSRYLSAEVKVLEKIIFFLDCRILENKINMIKFFFKILNKL